MKLLITRITEFTPPIEEAFRRLLPQLSPRLGVPDPGFLRSVVQSPCTALFAAWDGQTAVGVLTLVWYDVPSGRKAWIEDVVVDAAARGCGAGGALVRAALEHAVTQGIEKVQLTSAPHRTAARALYREIGFEEAQTTVFAYKLKK